jgi:DNA-directed RNA polymerase subunit RPC12/RpoP
MLALLSAQNNKCAICSKELQLFTGSSGGFVDHCHKTKKIRGILCNKCNTNIGWLEQLSVSIEDLYSYINRM